MDAMGQIARDILNKAGKTYPQWMNPHVQFMFDSAVAVIGTRTAVKISMSIIKDEKVALAVGCAEVALGGFAEIMAYRRYADALSARKQT